MHGVHVATAWRVVGGSSTWVMQWCSAFTTTALWEVWEENAHRQKSWKLAVRKAAGTRTHEMEGKKKIRAHVGRLHYGPKSIRNLRGHFLLYLRPLADVVHDAVELGQADNLRGRSEVRAR